MYLVISNETNYDCGGNDVKVETFHDPEQAAHRAWTLLREFSREWFTDRSSDWGIGQMDSLCLDDEAELRGRPPQDPDDSVESRILVTIREGKGFTGQLHQDHHAYGHSLLVHVCHIDIY